VLARSCGSASEVGKSDCRERPREIVGIVGDVRQFDLSTKSFSEIYVAQPQQSVHCTADLTETRLHKSLVVRTSFLSKGLMDSLRKTVAELVTDSPVFGITTVRQMLTNSARSEGFFAQLLGAFAGVALLLAMIDASETYSYVAGTVALNFTDPISHHRFGIYGNFYGSPSVPGSLRKVRPGQWALIRVRKKIEVFEDWWWTRLKDSQPLNVKASANLLLYKMTYLPSQENSSATEHSMCLPFPTKEVAQFDVTLWPHEQQ